MRQVSEQFKAIQDEIIRPPLKLFFEIGSSVENAITPENISSGVYLSSVDGFDQYVAPIFIAEDCSNERYYAVLGDGKPVDDPNRICTPRDYIGIIGAHPRWVVPDGNIPMGVTPYTEANTEVVIVSSSPTTGFDFFLYPGYYTISFKGGLIPDYIRVERYNENNSAWETDTTIYNDDLEEEITFYADHSSSSIITKEYRRFYIKNTESAGRFQLNWIRKEDYLPYSSPVVFEDENIEGISINQEMDLTAQTLPSFEMTVECLDVDEIYTPESEYWQEWFTVGKKCYFKLGYEIGGEPYYVPFFFGKLTKVPSYSEGKITFNVAVDWNYGKNIVNNKVPFKSIPYYDANNASAGDLCRDYTFYDYLEDSHIFDKYSGFDLNVLANDAKSNYFGKVGISEARQLVANAMGGFILAQNASINVFNVNEIQYKDPADYLTRYDQVKNTLDKQSKIRQIVVTKNENKLSSEYVDVVCENSVTFEPDTETYVDFEVPFWAIGKISSLIPASNTGVTPKDYKIVLGRTFYYFDELRYADGRIIASVCYYNSSNSSVTTTPKARFYKVNNEQITVTQNVHGDSGEEYVNDNKLITNEFLADIAKKTAIFINEASEVYGVDVVQDFRYELGDVIRLETQKNIFKTCVITGKQHTLPGSNGHLTCRKIFSLLDSNISFYWTGATIQIGTDTTLTILELSGDVAVAGWQSNMYDNDNRKREIILFNVKKFQVQTTGGSPVVYENSITVTDKNGHDWGFSYYVAENVTIQSDDIPLKHTKSYQRSSPNIDSLAFGAINLIEAIYSDQSMTAPVDYDCSYTIT